MKFSTATIAVFAAVAYGQSISDLPSCALNCFIGPLSSDGCSSLTDFKCHCSKPGLLEKVAPCVQQKCPANVAAEVAQKAAALCKANGVDISVPGGGSSPSTTPAAPSSSAEASASASGYEASSTASAYESSSTYCPPSMTTSAYTTGGYTPAPTTYPGAPIPTGAAPKASAMAGAAAIAMGVAAMAL